MDPREHPVVPVKGNRLWRQDVIRRDRKEHDNICGYANRLNISGYTNHRELDRALVCGALPYCDPKCPCNFGVNSDERDNSSEDGLDYAYWEERNVAPTGGFRKLTDAEYGKLLTEGEEESDNIIHYGGSCYMCNDATQYGIHLRSRVLYELDCLRFEIWEYEDQVRREVHREIVKDTHDKLREDGQARVDALFSNPELFTRLYLEYCNEQLESVYTTVYWRYMSIVYDLFDEIYDLEYKYDLENRLPRFSWYDDY